VVSVKSVIKGCLQLGPVVGRPASMSMLLVGVVDTRRTTAARRVRELGPSLKRLL
jgi:hypothetical protein